MLLFVAIASFFFANKVAPVRPVAHVVHVHALTATKNQWVNNSLQYYNRITRGAANNNNNVNVNVNNNNVQVQNNSVNVNVNVNNNANNNQVQGRQSCSPKYLKSAMENYFALEKLRDNKPQHAEWIYRRLMDEFHHPSKNGNDNDNNNDNRSNNNNDNAAVEECNFSNLAVPTLLLGLLLQREERYEDARTVFEGFSHVLEHESSSKSSSKSSSSSHIVCCGCCARVLQAHALFEMKQDNPIKAVELIIRAVRMDKKLRPVLRWKLFRDAMVEYQAAQRRQHQLKRQQQQQEKQQLVGVVVVVA